MVTTHCIVSYTMATRLTRRRLTISLYLENDFANASLSVRLLRTTNYTPSKYEYANFVILCVHLHHSVEYESH